MLPDDGRSISWNVASLNMPVHDVINLLYYEYWTDNDSWRHSRIHLDIKLPFDIHTITILTKVSNFKLFFDNFNNVHQVLKGIILKKILFRVIAIQKMVLEIINLLQNNKKKQITVLSLQLNSKAADCTSCT